MKTGESKRLRVRQNEKIKVKRLRVQSQKGEKRYSIRAWSKSYFQSPRHRRGVHFKSFVNISQDVVLNK